MRFSKLGLLLFASVFLCLSFSGQASAQWQDRDPRDFPESIRETNSTARAQMPLPPLEGAVDPERYLLGPGDELELALFGRVTARVPVLVNAEGSIYVPNLGHVKIGGLSIVAARAHLADEFRKRYRGVQADITLLRPRRILIHVAGEVVRPGLVELQGPARVSEAVRAAAGLTGRASRRNLVIHRAGGSVDHADLDRYSILGSLADNPYLDDGDVVQVPAFVHTLELRGEVTRPGTFELRRGDHLSEIIALAGGTRAGADTDSVELWRFVSSTESRRMFLPLRAALADPPGAPDDLVLQPDDRIYVRQEPGWHRSAMVQVAGEVVHPGTYSIPPQGQRASELIARFGGVTQYADLNSATVFRPDLIPTQDSAYVRSLRPESGREEAEFLKARSQASGTLSVRFRKLVAERDPGSDFDLRDGDLVRVPTRTGSVGIYGAVRRPGAVAYRPGARLEEYVRDVGGFGERADRGKVRVTKRSTGQPMLLADTPSIDDGDLVWVPERERVSFIKTVGNVTGYLAQVATVYLVIHQATK
ncbi:MAG TPA: SLBB domain-containing protein [Candidatus Dormibacteraeota bacterium]|nr:SLBB domain-containing protein [Candidatus Dormibacteraeota bacterium]